MLIVRIERDHRPGEAASGRNLQPPAVVLDPSAYRFIVELDTEEAKKVLDEEQQKRAEACQAKVQEVLDEFNCRIDVVEIRRNGRLEVFSVEFVALEALRGRVDDT